MKREQNRMTQAEHFKLCTWVQNNKTKFATSDSFTSLAEMATKSLSMPITQAHVKSAFQTLEMHLVKKNKTQIEQMRIVSACVGALYTQLGVTFPLELKELLNEIN